MKAAVAVLLLTLLSATAFQPAPRGLPRNGSPGPLVYRVDDAYGHATSTWFFTYYPWNSTIITDKGERFNGSAIHIASIGVDLPLCIDIESYNSSVGGEPVEIAVSRGDRIERIRVVYMLWFLGDGYAADTYYYHSNGVLVEAHISSNTTPYTVDVVLENTTAIASVPHASSCIAVHGLGENTTSSGRARGYEEQGASPPLYQLLVIVLAPALALLVLVKRRTVAK